MNMGERIKQLRIASGLTQEELGKYIGVQKSAIRKYEKGQVQNMKRSSIEILSRLFNVNPSYLMCIEDNNHIPEQITIPLIRDNNINDIFAKENIVGSIPFTIDKKSANDYFAYISPNNLMSPLLDIGDIAFIHKQDKFTSGGTYLLRIENHSPIIRKVIETSAGIDLYVISILTPIEKNITKDKIHIIGKVIKAQNESYFN